MKYFRRSLIAIEARKDELPPGPNQKWGEYSLADWLFYVKYTFYTNALIDEINAFDQAKIVEQARTFRP